MNTPHTHPRATEFLYLVNGSLTNGMITETGSRFIINNITSDQAMLLPQVRTYIQVENTHVILTSRAGLYSLPVQ